MIAFAWREAEVFGEELTVGRTLAEIDSTIRALAEVARLSEELDGGYR